MCSGSQKRSGNWKCGFGSHQQAEGDGSEGVRSLLSIFTAELKGGTIFKKAVTHKEERQPCLGQQGLPIFMVSDRVVGKEDWEGESSLVKKERNSGENVPEATAVRSTHIQCC